ncbi:MAG TPA: TetR/AcrR family transcriptional regulator [Caulobacteraceae bacterium]|nr:TetR/AcrR family transcriptional regulator [Caulobacteraceae bacterium]
MPAPAQPKRRRSGDRERDILQAARDLLETKGLVDTSVADVAAGAGVSEATVFAYFHTRRELMFHVIGDWMVPIIERLEADLPHISGVRARLNFFATRHLREMVAAPGMHKLIYRELHWDNYYGSALHRWNQRYTRLVGWIIEQGQAEGELRMDINAAIMRDMLFGAFQHVGWRTSMNGRALEVETVAERIVDQLCLGAFAPGRPAGGSAADALAAVADRLERVADRLESRLRDAKAR